MEALKKNGIRNVRFMKTEPKLNPVPRISKRGLGKFNGTDFFIFIFLKHIISKMLEVVKFMWYRDRCYGVTKMNTLHLNLTNITLTGKEIINKNIIKFKYLKCSSHAKNKSLS